MLTLLLSAGSELWVCFHTTFCQIHTFELFFFRYSDTQYCFQNGPNNQRSNEYPDEDSQSAYDLAS